MNWKTKSLGTLVLAGALFHALAARAEHPVPGFLRITNYVQTNLVADTTNEARFTDPNLVNSWGIVAEPGMLAVSDNGTGLSTFYRAGGHPEKLVVMIPAPTGDTNLSAPTGLVFNRSRQFVITNVVSTNEVKAYPSILLYAAEDGTIAGWNPWVSRTNAIIAVDHSTNGAVYKGITFAWTHDGPRIYVSNFKAGMIEIYDGDFELVKSVKDTNAPAGFAPFGIRAINGRLFVTLAKQKAPDNHDDETGAGNGYIDEFDLEGNFVKAFAAQGTLNSPWGLTLASRHFGKFSRALLVGNFGDGHINAFNPHTGAFLGQLDDATGSPLTIDGLWGLTFNGAEEGSEFLYFTSGPGSESHGLLGIVRPGQPPHMVRPHVPPPPGPPPQGTAETPDGDTN